MLLRPGHSAPNPAWELPALPQTSQLDLGDRIAAVNGGEREGRVREGRGEEGKGK